MAKTKRGPGWGLKSNYNPGANILGGGAATARAKGRGVVKKDGRGGGYIDWKAKRPKDYEIGKEGLEKRSKAAGWKSAADRAKVKSTKRGASSLLGTAKRRKDHEDEKVGTGLLKGY